MRAHTTTVVCIKHVHRRFRRIFVYLQLANHKQELQWEGSGVIADVDTHVP
jgi:hypothetical protein